jgi:hypothetical protein
MHRLLAARDRRDVRRDRSGREHLYVLACGLGSLMRHLRGLASIEVALLPGGVVSAALVGALIPAARGLK